MNKVFVITPPHPQAEAWFGLFLAAAKKAGVGHVVKLSGWRVSPTSQAEVHRQMGRADEALQASGLGYTILRPNVFFQNMFRMAGQIRAQGRFQLAVGDACISMIDVRDIAAVALKILTEEGHLGKVYDLSGPESITYFDIARHLSAALEREIAYVPLDAEDAVKSQVTMGVPERAVRARVDVHLMLQQRRFHTDLRRRGNHTGSPAGPLHPVRARLCGAISLTQGRSVSLFNTHPTERSRCQPKGKSMFQVAEAYEVMMGRFSRQLAPLFIQFTGIGDGDVVLDVGCGTGALASTLASMTDAAKIVGIDLSAGFIQAARREITDPRVSIELGDAQKLPYADASFDRCLALLIVNFIPDAPKAAKEIRRVTKPGGVVATTMWDSSRANEFNHSFWNAAIPIDPTAKRPCGLGDKAKSTIPREVPGSFSSGALRRKIWGMNFRVEIEQEEDGRWIAEVTDLPGVLAYGSTSAEAQSKVQALALRVIADRLEHGEAGPDLVNISFAAA